MSSVVCKFKNCKVNPSYNFKNNTTRLYCNRHRLEGMVNLKVKMCIFKDCNEMAMYGLKTDRINIFCKNHKNEQHVNVNSTRKNNQIINTSKKYSKPTYYKLRTEKVKIKSCMEKVHNELILKKKNTKKSYYKLEKEHHQITFMKRSILIDMMELIYFNENVVKR